MVAEKHKLLACSWTTVAQRYDQELVPRFKPYTQRLLSLFLQRPLPTGPVYVPACGPGHELVLLGEALPGRQLFGVDLAAGMVELADQKLAQAGLRLRSELAVGDACSVPGACRPAAGMFSCFSLQQMPQPAAVLAAWAAALAPGGVLAVAYWPPAAAPPDARWRALTDPATLAKAVAAAPASCAHAHVLVDEAPAFDMHFDSAAAFFGVDTCRTAASAAPQALGQQHMAELRRLRDQYTLM
ncbi:hypothetical protein WJX81_003378 [Elliptochloris bilobata]|uniref:Methyltransferase domain-containing protein n=1 Tax=Elliptochloris bilobata TaxID=381761 RepID=A0AAW1RI95_9CHLO